MFDIQQQNTHQYLSWCIMGCFTSFTNIGYIPKCHFMQNLPYYLNVIYFPDPASLGPPWPEAECTLNSCIEPVFLSSLPTRAADRGRAGEGPAAGSRRRGHIK